jgi:hypothetical protein
VSRLRPDDPGKSGREHVLITWVFLRLLALIYGAAFASLLVQIKGLVGAEGILPLSDYLDRAHEVLGDAAYWKIPTVFWLDDTDAALARACWAGILASLFVLIGRAEWLGLLLCYGLYLSLTYAGQSFTSFQWDVFLLESGFLALFLTGRSTIVVWLYRFLVFRFMLMGGLVKLASGDLSWRQLTALNYHFETQPLPSPLAWYAHHLPAGLLAAGTAAVLVIELMVPFLIFLPRPFRLFAAASFILLQLTIILTGSYTFFNLLTIILCIFLLDDRDIRPLLKTRLVQSIVSQVRPTSRLGEVAAGLMALFVMTTCVSWLWFSTVRETPPQPLASVARVASTLGMVNGYGPFAVMTTERREIVVEGSDDGEHWRAYAFRYKPGDLAQPLSWNIPHQPRLDWQMWFAALGSVESNPWFSNFIERLRQGSTPVLALLSANPFPDHPPRWVRAMLYQYTFTTPEERDLTGQIWRRELLGTYSSP